jgi:hypothetical protein
MDGANDIESDLSDRFFEHRRFNTASSAGKTLLIDMIRIHANSLGMLSCL